MLIGVRIRLLHGKTVRDELSACTALRTVTSLRDRFMLNGCPYTLCLVLEDQAWHLHAQIYPPYRTRGRLQYLAGTEIAAGFFAMDALPEDKAAELQQVQARF
jgi:galactose-1-phosphate uridylyltransferase